MSFWWMGALPASDSIHFGPSVQGLFRRSPCLNLPTQSHKVGFHPPFNMRKLTFRLEKLPK